MNTRGLLIYKFSINSFQGNGNEDFLLSITKKDVFQEFATA